MSHNTFAFSYIHTFDDYILFSSSSLLFIVGNVKPEIKDLVVTTYEAWKAAIAYCKPGNKYQDIGGIIEEIISKKGINCTHTHTHIYIYIYICMYINITRLVLMPCI